MRPPCAHAKGSVAKDTGNSGLGDRAVHLQLELAKGVTGDLCCKNTGQSYLSSGGSFAETCHLNRFSLEQCLVYNRGRQLGGASVVIENYTEKHA